MNNYETLITDLVTKLATARDLKQAIEIKNIFTKEHLMPLYGKLKSCDIEEKKILGKELNQFKTKIELALNERKEIFEQAEDKLDESLLVDNSLPATFLATGRHHLINQMIDDVIDFFQRLNFDIVDGAEVVLDKFNFEHLNIPLDHPARNMHDSLFFSKEVMLRTHCTVTTAEKLFNNKNDDIRILSYGNVYRKDEDDATHSHQFTQVDFVWLREDINLANLKWLIDNLMIHIFGRNTKTRYRLSYFPFTEPSFEVDVACFKCNGKGCNICKQSTWIEILGAGMLHPNVMKTANIKKNQNGIAAGIGIERLVMLKHGITDIRDLYNNDFKFNKQFR